MSPSGQRVATTDRDGVRLWTLSDGQMVALDSQSSGARIVAFSPNGELIAADDYGAIRLWTLPAGRESRVTQGAHGDTVRIVTFSPDGNLMASGSQDATARVWETASGREVARMAYPDPVDVVRFSPDGAYLVTAGRASTIDIWDLRPSDSVSKACGCLTRNLTPEEWRTYLGEEPYRPTCPH